MAELTEGDFELDGYLIGRNSPVYVHRLDPGTAGARTQDADNPVGDDTFFGVDYLTGPTWTFTLIVNGERDVAAAVAALDDLSDFWHSANRRTPGAVSTLRYMRGGQVRRVYGRPREFSYDMTNLWVNGRTVVTAAFKTSSPFVYEDEPQTLRLDLIAASSGGVVFPTTFPLRFASSGERQGVVTGGGTKPAPFKAVFHAPAGAKDPYLRSDGWDINLRGELAYDRTISVDTRTRDVRLSGLKLSRKTRFTGARIDTGPTELVFGAIDSSGSAYCDITWHRTYTTF